MKHHRGASLRPKVLANIVVTLDGNVPTGARARDILASKDIKSRLAEIRALGDAVLSVCNSHDSNLPHLLLRATKPSKSLTPRFPNSLQNRGFHAPVISMSTLLDMLSTIWGVKTLVYEAGMTLSKSFIEEDFVDDLYLTILPIIIGGSKLPSLTGLPSGFLKKNRRFRLMSLQQNGDLIHLHYIRDRKKISI